MAAREQRHQDLIHDLVLPDNDLAELGEDPCTSVLHALGAGVLLGALPPLVLVAFLPNTAKVALALARRTAIGDVRRTGIVEALHAGLFAALLVAAYALG